MRTASGIRRAAPLLVAVTAALVTTITLAFGSGSSAAARPGVLVAVGAESQYADVIAQIGGRYVQVSAVMSNPNTDPHTFEASIAVVRQIGAAALVVQNGLGYDDFMNTIENATPNAGRTVLDVQRLLTLPDSTPNPHLWYSPAAVPRVAAAVVADLARLQPSHAAYFQANASAFLSSLKPLTKAIASFRAAHPDTPVASTEPVANYLLQAAGADNLTPWTFQADIMNGVDPSPQDVAAERALLADHKVKALVYNEQVTDPLTESLITLASQNHIPVVGVYETMPEPGYDYQTWMLAEITALRQAVDHHISAEHL